MSLTLLAWISIAIAILCALFIAMDETRHPQSMAVMNIVWPVTALYFSIFALWGYLTIGRRHTRERMQYRTRSAAQPGRQAPPTASQIATGTSHCGAGCMIADVVTEFALAASGLILLGSVLWTEYILDFIAAWLLGIVFQYFAIKPMRSDLNGPQAIVAAIKADTLSILAFQLGMYAWMALVYFRLFTAPHLTPFDPRFWLMMQIAMICGFAASYPMNRLLISIGIKEAM
ncbi:MAG TPA: DUF4396 domain-containing protein [Acidobacteriaceae bacterium]|jgi:hypothetical protein|nr:DUF4396 domain-containing protein [Acidobacteriaceae bacterium]